MRGAELRAALLRWDKEIVDSYLRRLDGEEIRLRSCAITLQADCARDLVLVTADVASKSAERLGPALTGLDHAALRDATLGIAVTHYVAAMARSRKGGDNALAERILTGLAVRLEAADNSGLGSLLRLTVLLPAEPYDALTEKVSCVLGETDLSELGDYRKAIESDLLSSVVEAIATEWMHQRAGALGVRIGRHTERSRARLVGVAQRRQEPC